MKFGNCLRSSCRSALKLITMEIIIPVIIQPMLVLFVTLVIPDNLPLIALIIGIVLVILIQLAKHDLRSHLLYYWVVLSITYTIIVFELIVVPLLEIESQENFFLVFLTVISLFSLYLTISGNNKPALGNVNVLNNRNGEPLLNGNGCSSICPVCKIKMQPRNYHCHICQECIPKYDHHSYWLNCCIGEKNLHYYFAGIFFGIFALIYASLLILTTVCSPEYQFGILLPEDCTDVGENIQMCACLVCGIYCIELAVILFFKVIHHSWLISKGISTFEWKEQHRISEDFHKDTPVNPSFMPSHKSSSSLFNFSFMNISNYTKMCCTV